MPTLIKAPAQVIIDPVGSNITINRDQQLNDLTVSPELDTSPLNSQASSRPIDYVQTGVSLMVDVSIADMDLKLSLFALALNNTIATAGQDKRLSISDLAGIKVPGKKVIIKPYNGLIPDTDQNNWLVLPNAKIVALEGTNLTFGLNTQQELRFRFVACPDNTTGVKWIFGNETVP